MINDKKILAIIPARGGSKRLPRKNILPIAGKPLIQWTIEASTASKYIDTTFVSTDSSEIASIAIEHGLNVPYLRSDSLSSDIASSMDVILDAINNYELKGHSFDLVLLLQPTSPLRDNEDIDGAIELFIKKSAGAVVSVTECDHSPLWANVLPSDFNLSGFIPDSVLKTRSQDLPTYYRLNGAIYLFEVKNVKNGNSYLSLPNSFGFPMSKSHSIDIDDENDFIIAEALLASR
ncbi:acylneuraminate cytidylyltransferase family protein [Pseudoalteromonas sp. MMG007]|uniref:acylneuraminate cytidylyltransferase family protein n=1 Tax=Pseudoalteromonas sp. MMG007 TaxID=2822684 RepID=UPI001B368539|nr:acylneuraminate cytidylyltransferase family protein [Pseudoalteromonas sp. MMG007]MBQ4858425.1 acylneuraminate cytidylyltransferase family protein [Pseudoalteromonas sp. MMG007]